MHKYAQTRVNTGDGASVSAYFPYTHQTEIHTPYTQDSLALRRLIVCVIGSCTKLNRDRIRLFVARGLGRALFGGLR
jgi:hypothetical protein